ncbi:MAG: hypothetical protein ABI896_07555 [Actinomycetota bacterium]
MRPRPRSLTEQERETFLEALGEGWSISKAAQQAGRERRRFYDLQENDEAFADAWAEAYEQGTQRLEDEATRRGLEGYEEETRDSEGKVIRSVRRFDSALLQQQLRARRPAVYRENVPLSLNTPAVFVLDSAFGKSIEALAVKPPLALPAGPDHEEEP